MNSIVDDEYDLDGSMQILYLNRRGEQIGWIKPSVVMLAMRLSHEKKKISSSFMRAIVTYAFAWRRTSKGVNYWFEASRGMGYEATATGTISEQLAKEMLVEMLRAELMEYHSSRVT